MKWSRDGQIEMDRLEKLLSPSLPVNQRLEFLRTEPSGLPGAWDSARIAQFLSWSCLGWFSRADYNLVVTHKTGCFSLAISTTIDVVI